jgi:hypothetical protein
MVLDVRAPNFYLVLVSVVAADTRSQRFGHVNTKMTHAIVDHHSADAQSASKPRMIGLAPSKAI